MISINATEVKTNMCFSFNETLFIARISLCDTVQTYNTYTTKITTITILLLSLSAYNFFASNTCTLFPRQLGCSNMQLFRSLAVLPNSD